MMSRKRVLYQLYAALLALIVVLVAVLAVKVIRHGGRTLTREESHLIGTWREIDSPSPERVEMTFEPDGVFWLGDRLFKGHWRVEQGKLWIRCWRDQSSLLPMVTDVTRSYMASDDVLYLAINASDPDSVVIGVPGMPSFNVEMRRTRTGSN